MPVLRTAKCEAFHFVPRLFFMFLFLIPFTIRQHSIIYPQECSTCSTEPLLFGVGFAEWFDGAVEAVGLLGFAHIAAV